LIVLRRLKQNKSKQGIEESGRFVTLDALNGFEDVLEVGDL